MAPIPAFLLPQRSEPPEIFGIVAPPTDLIFAVVPPSTVKSPVTVVPKTHSAVGHSLPP